MKILVLGSGVIGATTAYVLAARGHEVEVIDRGDASGLETSFSNGGQLSFSHAQPWANPAVLPKMLKWMFKKDAPLIFRLKADWQMMNWGLHFLANCRKARSDYHTVNTLRLGLYSKKKHDQISQESGVTYDNARKGILHVFSLEKELAGAAAQSEYQTHLGSEEKVFTREQCIAQEPVLAYSNKPIIGGIYAPIDESGDALSFTQGIAKAASEKGGAVFHYNVSIRSFLTNHDAISGVDTDKGIFKADCYVMALGPYSPLLLRPIGVRVPIYPLKGYSVTVPADENAPQTSITDNELKIVYSRLGNRLRAAGTAEIAGYDDSIVEHRITPILNSIRTLFPRMKQEGTVDKWACLRPSTPDGAPILGATRYKNLYMNTGHGTLGWTMAAGSAHIVADVIDGKQPEISLDGLTMERFA